MKKILVSGDSWTAGWPLEESVPREKFTWPNLVAQHFESDLIDKSRSASSNYRIFRKGFEGILDSSVDTVILFLTSWTRWETGSGYGDKPGRIYQQSVRYKHNVELFKNFFNGYKQYTDCLRQIISLQSMAKTYGTACYFLDNFDNNVYNKHIITEKQFKSILSSNIIEYDNMDNQRVKEKFNKVLNLYKHVDKKQFISLRSYQDLIKGCKLVELHPVEDGHKQIARIVIDFLEGENSGQTI